MVKKNIDLDEELIKVIEELQLDEAAPLTLVQRRKRAMTMRRYKSKMVNARARARRKKAPEDKLKMRARRKARNMIRKRLSVNKNYANMSPAEKMAIDTRLAKISSTVIDRIAVRQLPIVRRAEMDRVAALAHSKQVTKEDLDINEAFESFLVEASVKALGPKYHMMFDKDKKVKSDKRFKIFSNKGMLIHPQDIEQLPDVASIEEMAVEEFAEMVEAYSKKLRNKDNSPEDREQGTDSLVNIYKKDTPGESCKNESYPQITRGDVVDFRMNSVYDSGDMADGQILNGTVVGSDTNRLRIRAEDGKLYLVRHDDIVNI